MNDEPVFDETFDEVCRTFATATRSTPRMARMALLHKDEEQEVLRDEHRRREWLRARARALTAEDTRQRRHLVEDMEEAVALTPASHGRHLIVGHDVTGSSAPACSWEQGRGW